jgi:hypothetical protein
VIKTKQALITDVERELSQSAGPGVQIYAQDIIAGKIEQAWEHCSTAEWWPQFRRRETKVLDGVTGQVTTDFTHLKQWDDIQHVFASSSNRPLPQLPAGYNASGMIGTAARFIEASGDAKLFIVYPLTSLDSVHVVGRTRRTSEHALTDQVNFDHLALVHFAAWSYFIDDQSNPAAAAKHEALFNQRMKTLKNQMSNHAVLLDPRSISIPDRWF